MQRSREIFLKILKFSPRNTKALKYLLIINEKLKEYKNASDIIECLNEIGTDTKNDKIFINTLKIINDSIDTYEIKSEKLYKIFKKNPLVERIIAQFYLQFNKDFFWKHVDEFDLEKFIDLMWYLNFDDIDFDKVSRNKFLNELYNAKGYLKTLKHSDDFVFDILIILNYHQYKVPTTINFEFICNSCKHMHPIFDTRCPHCHNILTFKVKHNLAKQLSERNQSLQ
jgi:hypothetical protein